LELDEVVTEKDDAGKDEIVYKVTSDFMEGKISYRQCSGSEIRRFLTPRSSIRNGKNPDPGSTINIPDNIAKSLVTINWVKNA
jgi:hypothetical protein